MEDFIKSAVGVGVGIVAILILIAFFSTCTIISPGERGVKVTLGKISPEVYEEGVHFITPFVSHISKWDVKTQKMNPATTVFTKDIQQARLVYVVNYNLIPSECVNMYREVGKDYKEKVLIPIVEGTLKNVIGNWNAQDLIANRAKATTDILLQLKEQLADNYINVTDFQITDIDYSDNFEKAIEEKVTAEQEALKAKNKTVQVQEEARQKILTAEAEAKAIQLKAQALANNKQIVELEYAKKWDGKLPEYMMGGSVPFINVGKK